MNNSNTYQTDIAIIGMSGRFPGARNLAEFWTNLRNGVESISFFHDDELDRALIPEAIRSNPKYVRAKGVLQDADLFDAGFFGFSPREAEITDPQQRVFLECAWEALESAGYSADRFKGHIGIYSGIFMSTYLLNNLLSNGGLIDAVGLLQTQVGNDKDHLSTLVAYKLNLTGPAITVQTACSTSLVAVHLAIQSLLSGECDMGLAGGVTVTVPQKAGYLYREGGVASPDGHCRAFDARGQGTLTGNGAGTVVLKRMADALADGDTIQAVIKGSAVNNDGAVKVGYTAPSIQGQARVIAEALALAAVDPETIAYVEAHGTATPIGDPIEVAALTQVFRESTDKKNFCAIGSVKTNLGHLQAAAGITGLIKTVLAIKHGLIPPSLHFQEANPKIDFDGSPFYVNTKLSAWPEGAAPCRAAVSSFGIGGTNAHLILEEAPPAAASEPARGDQLLLLSAKSAAALEAATDNLARHLEERREINLADVAFTLQVGRSHFGHRRALVAGSLDEALKTLETRDARRLTSTYYDGTEREVVFMFPGLGDHYADMARGLYEAEPRFQREVDRCAQILTPLLKLDIRETLYPKGEAPPATPARHGGRAGIDLRQMLARRNPAHASDPLARTDLAQPALFVVEYALARLLQSWGIRPGAMIGYSLGEYVAACLSGVMSLEDTLKLVAQRAQLIHRLDAGAMLAVLMSEAEAAPLLNQSLSLAGINGPNLCVLSGRVEAVEEVERRLAERQLTSRRLPTTQAFHSTMMLPLSEPLKAIIKDIQLKPPAIPYVSNVTGTWITPAQATDPNYWVEHLCSPVRFGPGIAELLKEPARVLVEVGPGQMLAGLALQLSNAGSAATHTALPTIRTHYDHRSDTGFLLQSLGHLWLAGIDVDWPAFHKGKRRRRLPLPTYAFERQRYWVEAKASPRPEDRPEPEALKRPDLADWFYAPVWQQSLPANGVQPDALIGERENWLVFADGCGIGEAIARRLKQRGQPVVTVRIGERFMSSGDDEYEINPLRRDDCSELLGALQARGTLPDRIVHLWAVSDDPEPAAGDLTVDEATGATFNSLLHLAQVVEKQMITQPIRITLISSGLHVLTGSERMRPARAAVLGPALTVSREVPNLSCACIDIDLPPVNTWQRRRLIDRLLVDLAADATDARIAYRNQDRWTWRLAPAPLPPASPVPGAPAEDRAYVIVGALQPFALACARYFTDKRAAKTVILTSAPADSAPEPDPWGIPDPYAATGGRDAAVIQDLEATGAEVMRLDLADAEALCEGVRRIEAQYGEVRGVILVSDATPDEALRAIGEIDRAASAAVLAKAAGELAALEKTFGDRRLDFRLFASPASFVHGGKGRIAELAAECFGDAFVRRHNLHSPERWTSVHFDAEQFAEAPPAAAGFAGPFAALRLTPEERSEVIERLLYAAAADCLFVSSGRLDTGSSDAARLEAVNAMQASLRPDPASAHPRPDLAREYVPPGDDLEMVIAEMWQELLGVERVGIHDSFFELGGHSLLGTQLNARLHQIFPVDLPLMTLFELPTVANLAQVIRELLLEKLEELPEEEAQRLV